MTESTCVFNWICFTLSYTEFRAIWLRILTIVTVLFGLSWAKLTKQRCQKWATIHINVFALLTWLAPLQQSKLNKPTEQFKYFRGKYYFDPDTRIYCGSLWIFYCTYIVLILDTKDRTVNVCCQCVLSLIHVLVDYESLLQGIILAVIKITLVV